MNAEEKIRELYKKDLPVTIPKAKEGLPSILHVAAVYEDNNSYKIIRVDSSKAPRSNEDFFALNLARARVDAIFTSGKVIREEADLSHSLQGPFAKSLEEYRTKVLGKASPPYSLIFTRGSPDLESSFFDNKTRPVIYTSTDGYNSLDKKVLEEKGIIAKDGGASPTVEEALAYLKEELGVETVSMEAGPSVSNDLYNKSLVSELMLSIYSGKISPEAIGNEFVSKKTIEENLILDSLSNNYDGWTFKRYSRNI